MDINIAIPQSAGVCPASLCYPVGNARLVRFQRIEKDYRAKREDVGKYMVLSDVSAEEINSKELYRVEMKNGQMLVGKLQLVILVHSKSLAYKVSMDKEWFESCPVSEIHEICVISHLGAWKEISKEFKASSDFII